MKYVVFGSSLFSFTEVVQRGCGFFFKSFTLLLMKRYATIETKKGVKYVNGVNDVVLVFLLLSLNLFHTFLECFYC